MGLRVQDLLLSLSQGKGCTSVHLVVRFFFRPYVDVNGSFGDIFEFYHPPLH